MALTKVTGSVIKDSVSLSGNVSVGGTLTYQDVTNVDALGIGTFRTGIKVLAGQVDIGSNIKLGNAGVVTATSFSGALSGTTGSFSGQVNVGSNIKLGTAGVITATSFVGSGANLTGIALTSLNVNGNTNNNLITATGNQYTVQGEANLTFDGNDLTVTGTAPAINFIDTDADDYKIHNVQGVLKITDTTASADRFVINDNGTGYFLNNFQIGSTTSSPGATLHINTSYPSLKVDSGGHASDAYVRIISGNAQNSRVDFGDSDDDNIGIIDYDHANNSMSFTTNTTERLRIDSNGRLMVNQTTHQGSTSKFEVTGTLDNSYPGYSFPLMISDDAAYNSSAGPGGGVGFSFKQNSGGAYAQAGGIRGIKENTTDGNYASALTFYTRPNGGGTAERMRISSSGYVTKPAHPSFCARHQSDSGFSGDIILLTRISTSWDVWNTGGHYSTSTGKFTAPVTGVYYFEGQLMTTGHSNGDNIQDMLSLMSNNGRISYCRQRESYFSSATNANGYYTNSVGGSTRLDAGDTVWIQRHSSQNWSYSNRYYSYFTGWLIG